jgi:hypothetical protein
VCALLLLVSCQSATLVAPPSLPSRVKAAHSVVVADICQSFEWRRFPIIAPPKP